jgi:Sulfotransferase domain
MPERLRRAWLRRRAGLGLRGRVFVIGLSRTGTSSLTVALEQLGFCAVHFPADDRSQAEVHAFLSGDRGRLRLSLLDTVDAITDTPVAASFEGLDAAYPGSRFVLTVRERKSWLASCRGYWENGVEPFLESHPGDPWSSYISRLSLELYGTVGFDADRFSASYDAHLARVREHFRDRPDRLLTMDICGGDGWEALCGFLGLPAPDLKFPWERSTPKPVPAAPGPAQPTR